MTHQVLISASESPPSVLRHKLTPPVITRFSSVGSPAQIALLYQPCSPRYCAGVAPSTVRVALGW
jgi:hypothetical protein